MNRVDVKKVKEFRAEWAEIPTSELFRRFLNTSNKDNSVKLPHKFRQGRRKRSIEKIVECFINT